MPIALPVHVATRYATPLREGGSLPAVVETETGGLYVAKFRGAGQGELALVAEIIVGLLAAYVGLPVPELALIELDSAFGRTERDSEIQDILRASHGLNVGLRFLDGAFGYDPVAGAGIVAPRLAADIVWLDAFVSNVDRTPRNTNILVWRGKPWLIDHGAALIFHHRWAAVDRAQARRPFAHIAQHVLLPVAGDLRAADERLAGLIDTRVVHEILALVPDELLVASGGRDAAFDTAEAHRSAYAEYFEHRLASPRAFVDEAIRQQARVSGDIGQPGDAP